MRLRMLAALGTGLCLAQSMDVRTLSGSARSLQFQAKIDILRSAEKMPAPEYLFRPAREVRSFAQLLGHIADDNYVFCGAALGEPRGFSGIEKSISKDPIQAKRMLLGRLQSSFAYCDRAYAALNDKNATQVIDYFGQQRVLLGVLSFNTAHCLEHYGNIVTYLRMKEIVPPSSEHDN
jgi:uncharacterized damage-inducible protein DinB